MNKVKVVYTDEHHNELGYLEKCTLDLVTGDDDHDFELSVPEMMAAQIKDQAWIYTEPLWFGGVIHGGSETSKRKNAFNGGRPTSSFTFTGQTWEGVLSERAVDPDDSPILHVEGDLIECLEQILMTTDGLSTMFRVSKILTGVHVSYDLERVTDAYKAIRKMLRLYGYKLKVRIDPGELPLLYVEPAIIYGDVDGQNRCEYKLTWDTPYNSIVAYGKGEMEDRIIVRLYADKDHQVSETQTIFGFEERQYIYEYTTDDYDALYEDAWKKLEELQDSAESLRIDLPSDRVFDIGDTLRIISPTTGRSAKAEVNKTVLKIEENGRPVITNEVGDPTWEGQLWKAIRI